MRFLYGLAATAAISNLAAAQHAARKYLESRGDVNPCADAIELLQPSDFCSSFASISDSTTIATQTGTAATTKVTVTAPCTNPFKKRDAEWTPVCRLKTNKPAPSWNTWITWTTSKFWTTTPTWTTTSSTSSTTTASTTPITLCSSVNVPAALATCACDDITAACLAGIPPKTVTVTTFEPGPTVTGTTVITPTCPITTTRNRQPSTTPATTTSLTTP